MNDSDVTPSKWFYGLALLVLVVGFSFFSWSLLSGISESTGGLIQLIAPGTSELNLTEAGEYIIFYENWSYVNGSFYSTKENILGLQIEIIDKSTMTRLAVYAPPGSITYNVGGRSGRAILAFRVNHPGKYQFSAYYPQNYDGPQVVLALGKGFIERIFSTVLMTLIAFFGSIIIAAAIVAITYKKRRQFIEQQKEEERLVRGS